MKFETTRNSFESQHFLWGKQIKFALNVGEYIKKREVRLYEKAEEIFLGAIRCTYCARLMDQISKANDKEKKRNASASYKSKVLVIGNKVLILSYRAVVRRRALDKLVICSKINTT